MTDQFDCISDIYKSAHGVRPTGSYMWWFDSLTRKEQTEEWNSLIAISDQQAKYDAEDAVLAYTRFEKLLSSAIALGAKDRETALRWITADETFDNNQDIESYVYGLGFLFSKEGAELVKELEKLVNWRN